MIVTAGTYPVKEGLNPGFGVTNLYIHGDLGGPMPKIDADYSGIPIGNGEPGGRLEYLEVVNGAALGGGVFCGPGARIDRVRVSVSGSNAVALNLGGSCAVRDSLIQAKGPESEGVFAGAQGDGETGILRNVTVLAEAPPYSIAIWSTYNALDMGSYTLDVRNTIANGSRFDLYAFRAGHGLSGPGNILVANSNFDSSQAEPGASIGDGGSNQTAPPVFVNAAGGDYGEAMGSPTIDAGGVKDQLGPLDVAGNARVLGSAPDIGAYEFVPPPSGQIQSLALSYSKFRAARAGEAILSFKDKRLAPLGTTVTYSLSAASTTEFFVEKKVVGRKVKGKCKTRVTKANRGKKKCVIFKPIKSGFAHSGAAGQNSFKFSGRIGGAALKPGGYRLRAGAGGASKTAGFKIVK